MTWNSPCEDYRDDGALKTMSLKPDEWIRRFLLHALPDGFHRIRHFGFLANGHRTERLALCRSLLTNQVETTAHGREEPASPESDDRIAVDPPPCPEFGGAMSFVADIPRAGEWSRSETSPFCAILHEHRCEYPTDNHASRPFHRASNRRRSNRSAPSRRPSAHHTILARAHSSCELWLAVDRSPDPSCRPRVASPSGESALSPYEAHSSPANRPAPSFNPASMRSATVRTQYCAPDLTEASRFPRFTRPALVTPRIL